ncbi:MAG: UDP-2,4-diacetamido-2,4,6-trideoxy-beta-L-altropyranose hydrolase [Bacteroidota bacterium]
MGRPRIYFRADGSSTIGLGHVIRSLALAEMLGKQFQCTFLIQSPKPSLVNHIQGVVDSLVELPSSTDYLEEAKNLVDNHLSPGDIIILDGYGFNTACQQVYKAYGCKVACIDDLHTQHFVADVVINHAPGIKPIVYSKEDYTRLCLGLPYALLRPEFLQAAQHTRHFTTIDNLFICFGGADPINITGKILSNLQNLTRSFSAIHIVLGSANPHKKSLQTLGKEEKLPGLYFHENLSALEMRTLMKRCELAIVPASSLLFEIIAVKMPVISGYYIDNQKDVYAGFLEAGLIWGMGDLREITDYEPAFEQIEKVGLTHILEKQAKAGIGDSPQNLLNVFNTLNSGAVIHP